MPKINGLSHIDLSVSDIDAAERWYIDLTDATRVLDGRNEPLGFRYRYLMIPGPELLLGLIQHDAMAGAFDPTRPGLDHLAFAVTDRAGLAQWQARLDELGIPHNGIVEQATGDALPVRAPDGVQLEFYVSAAQLPWE
jgi:glyoxylase I family protein